MDIAFEKKSLPYLKTWVNRAQTQEQTQEVRLPEGMPDIGNVVSSWAQVILRSKEWRGDRISVGGGVMVWVMYLPEEENIPQSVAAWMPFQMKWEIPPAPHDGTILVRPFLQSVDARSLSARKLMVRATFGLGMEGLVADRAELFYPENLPEDIRILERTYPMCLPAGAGEKPFNLEESYPAIQPKPAQLIRYTLTPEITEWKLMADKLVFRGNAKLYALYRCDEGHLHTWNQEIPFSQYAELDREYDDTCRVDISCVLTNLELDLMEEGRLVLKSGICTQYRIFEETMVRLVEDAYSPTRQVLPQTEQLELPAILDNQTQLCRVEQTVETDASKVLDLAFYADEPRLMGEGDHREIQVPGMFQLLYLDPEDNYQSTNAYWEEQIPLEIAETGKLALEASPVGSPTAGLGSNGVSMQSDLAVFMQTVSDRGIPMVTGMDFGEEIKKDPNRPSLILRRAGEQTLWEIAKETGASVEQICTANALEGEPGYDQMLLIPIP